jgi:cellobiose phosphorylase
MAFAALGDGRRAWELLRMLNPVNHTLSPESVAVYKAEPYAVAADVYAAAPHVGRGGWTWYTGSAGWMYRLIVESLLGLERKGARLRIAPCMPEEWEKYTLDYRHGDTVYHIEVVRMFTDHAETEVRVTLDGIDQDDRGILLQDDHLAHAVEVLVLMPADRRAPAAGAAAVDGLPNEVQPRRSPERVPTRS